MLLENQAAAIMSRTFLRGLRSPDLLMMMHVVHYVGSGGSSVEPRGSSVEPREQVAASPS